MPPSPTRHLLVHQGALGDWVLTWPLMRRLRGTITAVSHASKTRLAARCLANVEPIDIEGGDWSRMYREGGADRIGSETRALLAEMDQVISFASNGDDAWARNMQQLAPQARCLFAHPRPPACWQEHVTQWHLHQLLPQGLDLQKAVQTAVQARGERILVHPGSGGRSKCWPIERYERLIGELRARGRQVRPLLGEVELETWPPAQVERWLTRWQAKRMRTLDELVDHLQQARLLVGNDSGPAHLAAQLGVPSVVLFGPTDPRVWHPVGPAVHIISPPSVGSMEQITLSQVLNVCEVAWTVSDQTGPQERRPGML